jgi:hypothetical protein
MSQMMGGGMNAIGMATQAAQNMNNIPNLIAYQANQEKYMSEVGKTFGGKGLQMMQMGTLAAQASYYADAVGGSFEDHFRLQMKQQGIAPSDIEANIAAAKGSDEIFRRSNAAAQLQYEREVMEGSYRDHSLFRFTDRVRDFGKNVLDTVVRPMDRIIEDVKEFSIGIKEEFGGIQRGSVAGVGLGRTIAGARDEVAGVVDLDGNRSIFGLGASSAGRKILET